MATPIQMKNGKKYSFLWKNSIAKIIRTSKIVFSHPWIRTNKESQFTKSPQNCPDILLKIDTVWKNTTLYENLNSYPNEGQWKSMLSSNFVVVATPADNGFEPENPQKSHLATGIGVIRGNYGTCFVGKELSPNKLRVNEIVFSGHFQRHFLRQIYSNKICHSAKNSLYEQKFPVFMPSRQKTLFRSFWKLEKLWNFNWNSQWEINTIWFFQNKYWAHFDE